MAARIEITWPPRPTPPPELQQRAQLVLVEERPRAPLPVAFAAYVAEAVVLGALRGAALTAVIAALAFVLAR